MPHVLHKYMQTPFFLIPLSNKIVFFRIARKLKNISKTNIILTFFLLIKIHLENYQKNMSHVCGEKDGPLKRCRTSAVVLAIFFLPLFINREVDCNASIVRHRTKSACSPCAVNEF